MTHLRWSVALIVGLLGLGTAAEAGPPPWAPAHGARAQGVVRYRYYPSLEIYFDPVRRVWFTLNVSTGAWQLTVSRPMAVLFGFPSYIELDIVGARPYVYHSQIIMKYPSPKRKANAGNRGGKNSEMKTREESGVKVKGDDGNGKGKAKGGKDKGRRY